MSKSHYQNSIIQDRKECFVTGWEGEGLHRHHIFHGSYRNLSEKYGMWIWLRWDYHIADSPNQTPHNNRKVDLAYKKLAQQRFEEVHGTREDFINIFGRNYIED